MGQNGATDKFFSYIKRNEFDKAYEIFKSYWQEPGIGTHSKCLAYQEYIPAEIETLKNILKNEFSNALKDEKTFDEEKKTNQEFNSLLTKLEKYIQHHNIYRLAFEADCSNSKDEIDELNKKILNIINYLNLNSVGNKTF